MNVKTNTERALLEKENQIKDLYVLIETLQSNLKSISAILTFEQKQSIESHSYKWCMKWSPGDEKK
mgnify:CR=1 FL=1